jgi:hypothetical protein
MSFASFGSAESRKSAKFQNREQSGDYQQRNTYQEQVGSDQDEAPPVEVVNTGDLLQQVENPEEFDEGGKAVSGDVEQSLLARIDAMQVESTLPLSDHDNVSRRNGLEPYIQFPEEESEPRKDGDFGRTTYVLEPEFMQQMMRAGPSTVGNVGRDGPSASDMIPALRGLSNLQVSFGSATDVPMMAADMILGKRAAGEEEEVQGQRLDLSLGLNYGGSALEGSNQKGSRQKKNQKTITRPGREAQEGKQNIKPTGHVSSAKKARPHVWTRQEK